MLQFVCAEENGGEAEEGDLKISASLVILVLYTCMCLANRLGCRLSHGLIWRCHDYRQIITLTTPYK